MRDALIRTVRTFAQGFIGVLAIVAVPVLNDIISDVMSGGEVVLDINLFQSIGVAACAGGVIAVVAFVQNLLEDKTGKALIK